ncbi:hypothetical protein Mapa_017453 [Marchantia paleacea]|nr:hypothetical protein Mapa_017453 [Marchantia paleacea]
MRLRYSSQFLSLHKIFYCAGWNLTLDLQEDTRLSERKLRVKQEPKGIGNLHNNKNQHRCRCFSLRSESCYVITNGRIYCVMKCSTQDYSEGLTPRNTDVTHNEVYEYT